MQHVLLALRLEPAPEPLPAPTDSPNATIRADAPLHVAAPGAVAASVGGRVLFEQIMLRDVGGGFYLEVSVVSTGGVAPARTNSTYTVQLGPPATLRWLRTPADDNLQDVYFQEQPRLEVIDRGGNRVPHQTHRVALVLSTGAGRLRGPKARYTRHGVVDFDRLRIKAPGFDKRLTASADGLQPAVSEPFGVVPHGIPHGLRFVDQPPTAVRSDGSVSTVVTVELFDVYGERVAQPPLEALAPFANESSRVPLSALCDALCLEPEPWWRTFPLPV